LANEACDVEDAARLNGSTGELTTFLYLKGFALPIFWGRGVFTYNWGFLPKRKPINVVTGNPISAEAFRAKGLEGEALIDAVHEAYVQGLRSLFDEYKDRTVAGKTRTESMQIVQ